MKPSIRLKPVIICPCGAVVGWIVERGRLWGHLETRFACVCERKEIAHDVSH
jgi:hypothetical protein